jgi:hypothetical protein
VTLDRTVLLYNRIIVDVFKCSAEADSVFDLPLHFAGTPEGLPEVEPIAELAAHDGYQRLKNVRRCKEPLKELDIAVEKKGVIHADFDGMAESYLAEGYADEMKVLDPVVIGRASGKDACFVATYQILTPGEKPAPVEVKNGKKTRIEVGDVRLTVDDGTRLEIQGKECPMSSAE